MRRSGINLVPVLWLMIGLTVVKCRDATASSRYGVLPTALSEVHPLNDTDCDNRYVDFRKVNKLTFDKSLFASIPPHGVVIGNGYQLQCSEISNDCDTRGPTFASCTRSAAAKGRWKCISNTSPGYPLSDIDIRYQAEQWPKDFCVYNSSWIMITSVEHIHLSSSHRFVVSGVSIVVLLVGIGYVVYRRRRPNSSVVRTATIGVEDTTTNMPSWYQPTTALTIQDEPTCQSLVEVVSYPATGSVVAATTVQSISTHTGQFPFVKNEEVTSNPYLPPAEIKTATTDYATK